jgi:ketosteroid isomerase-like protein
MSSPTARIADERAITRLLYAYCDAVDSNRTEDIVALFATDAVFDLGYGRVHSGHAELATMFASLDFYSATSHDLSMVQIDFVDELTANCRSHVYAFHVRADTGAPVHLWGRYTDVVRSSGDGWVIARRQLRAAAELGAPPARGRPGRWEPTPRRSAP